MEPERIVYVSCDSATLARDLKILCEKKYELKAWQCYDQFSRTVHVECVTLLQRMSNTRERTITLDVEMED
jgi:23S rRNA (uracil1939-C5)-methyltransferase